LGRAEELWVKRVRSAAAIAGLLMVSGGLAACGKSSGAPAADAPISGQTITLYNGQHEQTTSKLVDEFTKQTGVKVKVRSDDEDVLAQQIQQEGSKSPADVFFTENTPPLARLDEAKLLSPVDASTLAVVPPAYNAGDHNWVGVSARVSAIVYNTDKLQPSQLPKSILDLANAEWKGKLGIAPGETDFAPLVTSIAASHGDAAAVTWLKALKSNAGGKQEADNETLVADINKGSIQLGVINHYYWYRLQNEIGKGTMHSALAYFAPRDDGYLLDVSGAGVMKSSKHQKAAQALLAFLVSRQGETVLAKSDSFEYPLGSKTPGDAALPPFTDFQPKAFDLERIGDGKHAVDLLQEAGLL
jgi:iron(III) transport system substrate-binding protein